MIDQLKTIGIEKGKPFNPGANNRKILSDAAGEAHDWLDLKYQGHFATPYNEGSHWALPAESDVLEGCRQILPNPTSYPVDGRAVGYSMGFFSAKHLGTGQFYLMAIMDKAGQPFDGSKTYRLNVPANAPVSRYWSATAYERDHALIRNLQWSSRSSNTPGLQKNADGSVDVYFGPKLWRVRSRTGSRPARKESSKFSSVSTAPRSRSSKDVEAAGHRESEVKAETLL